MDDKGDEEGEGMTKEEVERPKKRWMDRRRGGEIKEEVERPKKRWRDQRRGGETKEEVERPKKRWRDQRRAWRDQMEERCGVSWMQTAQDRNRDGCGTSLLPVA